MDQQNIRQGLIDTDILIDASRGLAQAGEFLNSLLCGSGVTISAVSAMELIAGCQNAGQLGSIKQVLRQFTSLPITPDICSRAQALMEAYTLSHGLMLPDALVAATALQSDLALYTRNIRHYRMISELVIIQPY